MHIHTFHLFNTLFYFDSNDLGSSKNNPKCTKKELLYNDFDQQNIFKDCIL